MLSEKRAMRSKRVILDTNLWISFLISKNFSFLDDYVEKGLVKLVFSEELISEFYSIVNRPSLKKYFSKSDIEYLFDFIHKHGIIQEVTSDQNICRDVKDNFLLNLAIDSKSDYLVTGDNDLLVLGNINETKITTIKILKDKLVSGKF